MTILNYFFEAISPTTLLITLLLNFLSLLFLFFTYHSPRVGYLLAVFSSLALIRVLAINNLYKAVFPVFLAFLGLVILFFYIVYQNITNFAAGQNRRFGLPVGLSPVEWQLSFIRMYIGIISLAILLRRSLD